MFLFNKHPLGEWLQLKQPSFFSGGGLKVDGRGTLMKGAFMSGAVCVVTAALVPFDALNNIISAGVLLAFNFVTSSHLVLRHRWVMTHSTLCNSVGMVGVFVAKCSVVQTPNVSRKGLSS